MVKIVIPEDHFVNTIPLESLDVAITADNFRSLIIIHCETIVGQGYDGVVNFQGAKN